MVTITINGEVKVMQSIKARFWKDLIKFDSERDNVLAVDAVEKYCAVIAAAFGVTTDEVLDNLNIEEVIPKFFEVFNEIVNLLTAKLNKKNLEPDIATQA